MISPLAPLALAVALAAPAAAAAQIVPTVPVTPPERSAEPAPVPWQAGERLTYDVKFGALRVGSGSMAVVGIDTVRGQPAWRTAFTVRGGTFFYRVNDVLESWMDTQSLSSLRFVQELNEGSRDVTRRYEIYPDRQVYVTAGKEEPSVAAPLDDGSFFYFVRTLPLEVGRTYEFNRYFRPDRNPVIIRVLRKERIKVPAGTFSTIVVQPIIKAKGIFSEGGQAQIWFTNDSRRLMVQMKSKLSFGSLNLYLKSYQLSATQPPAASDR